MSTMTLEQVRDELRATADHADSGYDKAWAIRLADAIDALLRERESPKAVMTDEIVTVARDAYIRIRSLNWECENDTLAWRTSLEAVAPMLASARVPDGWRQDVALAASMLTWGAEEGLTESQERDVRTHQAKLFSMLAAAPKRREDV